jgi:curli biogenesis system outer membrane secretion channel CsgG
MGINGKILLTGLLASTCAMASAQAAAPVVRHKVAVLDFGYASVMTNTQAVFGTQTNIGKGISDMLVDKLTNDGTYRIIERNAIQKVLAEQNFSNSDRVDATSAAKIGKILGVDAIITGDITQFGRDDKNMNLGGAGGGWTGYALGKVGNTKSKAVVAITARLVDANTGEVLASTTSKGESKRSGGFMDGGGGNWHSGGGGGASMGSSNFAETIIGEATVSAVTQLATGLEAGSSKFGEAPAVAVQGMIADVAGSEIIINVGTAAGVTVGAKLMVMHPVRTVKDPATGKVLRSVENNVGQLTITSADATSATGTFAGSASPKVGDTVKSPTP